MSDKYATVESWHYVKLEELKWAVRVAEIKIEQAPTTYPLTHPDMLAAQKELRLAKESLRVFAEENMGIDNESDYIG